MKNRILKNRIFSQLSLIACLIACLVAFGVTPVAYATNTTTTILSSDFNSHGSPDGATSFSGISWFSNGVYGPGITTSLSPDAFVEQSGAAQNGDRLAVERNIDRAGPWTIVISFMSTVEDLVLENLTFDYQFISNSGVNQINAHPGSGVVKVSILDANFSTLSTVEIGPLGTNDRASNLGTDLVADFADVALTNGEMYFLSFTVSSNSTVGNNISVDNFSLNGSICHNPNLVENAGVKQAFGFVTEEGNVYSGSGNFSVERVEAGHYYIDFEDGLFSETPVMTITMYDAYITANGVINGISTDGANVYVGYTDLSSIDYRDHNFFFITLGN